MSDLDNNIHEDFRGKIERHEVNGIKFNVLFTKKDMLRSGDYHPVKQYDLILSGKIEITFRENDEDVKKIYGLNEFIIIPENIPHLFRFLEDTVMIEWWAGSFEAKYYKPYRDQIDEQFKNHNG